MPRTWAGDAIARLDDERDRHPPTPLIPFPLPGVRLLLKDESAHPTGGVKHRAARALFRHAIATGRITEGDTVVEATGGGAAVAQAYMARLLDLPYIAVMPGEPAPARAAPVEALGGEVRFHSPPAAIHTEAARLGAELGGCFLDQFTWAERALDWRGDDAAGELLDAVPAADWIVAGAGTGATAASVGRAVRSRGLATRLAVVDPENSAYFPGWAGGAADYATGMPSRIEGIGRPRMEPGFLPWLVDLVIPVSDAASCAGARAVREVTGTPVGGSTGAALWGALHLAARLSDGERGDGEGTVVAFVGDAAERHLGTYHDDGWAHRKGLDPAPYAAAIRRFAGGGGWEPPGVRG